MPTNKPFPIRVYLRNEAERVEALKILKQVDPDVAQYDSAAEGWVTREGFEQLLKNHLIVDSLEAMGREPTVAVPPEPAAEGAGFLGAGQEATPAPGAEMSPQARVEQMLSQKQFSRAAQRVRREDERVRRVAGRLRVAAGEFLKGRQPSDVGLLGATGGEVSAEQAKENVYELIVRMPMRREWREAIGNKTICSFEPPNIFRMFLTPQELARIKALPFVLEVRTYDIEKSVSESLLEMIEPAPAQAGDTGAGTGAPAAAGGQPAQFDLILHREQDRDKVKQAIARFGAKLILESPTVLRIEAAADPGLLGALAGLPEIKLLAPYVAPALCSSQVRALTGIERINKVMPPQVPDRWSGKGELVAVFDSGIDDSHEDLADRVAEKIAYTLDTQTASRDDKHGHGTHVAGIIAGTGRASNREVRGVAPEVRLISVGILANGRLLTPPDIADLLKEGTQRGAKILNLSWGKPIGGSYEQGAEQLDKFIYDNPEILVVVAAGNEGRAPDGWHKFNSIGTPATAKNALTVGACGSGDTDIDRTYGAFDAGKFCPPVAQLLMINPDLPAALSSRGPTDYDSVKPDVSACGVYVLAAKAKDILPTLSSPWPPTYPNFNGKYVYLGGTSMAAPVVSGLAAVLRQYLREQRNLADPSAALLKAILIASAERGKALTPGEGFPFEAKVGYPDFHQGFGRVDLSRILPHPEAPPSRKLLFDDVRNDSGRALRSHALTGQAKDKRDYVVTVPEATTEPLRIVLTWTDHPGNSIQNNLNVFVDGPNGSFFIGNSEHQYQRDAIFENNALNGMPFDKRNNVEHIKIGAPAPGRYTIHVVAQNTPRPLQGYALCLSGCVSENVLTGSP
jgi:hypothetical protein